MYDTGTIIGFTCLPAYPASPDVQDTYCAVVLLSDAHHAQLVWELWPELGPWTLMLNPPMAMSARTLARLSQLTWCSAVRTAPGMYDAEREQCIATIHRYFAEARQAGVLPHADHP